MNEHATAAQQRPAATVQAKMSEERKDFIKRLFAVTISVGFATQLSHLIPNLDQHRGVGISLASISISEWEELALLVTSLVAVVASWEGYLKSIHRDPLEEATRFYLDIAIVFVYLLLMLLSSDASLWFAVLASMFVLYFVWDIVKLTCRPSNEQGRSAAQSIGPRPWYQHGASITLIWLLATIALNHFKSLSNPTAFLFAWLAAVSIIVMYRIDKIMRRGLLAKAGLVLAPAVFIYLSGHMR